MFTLASQTDRQSVTDRQTDRQAPVWGLVLIPILDWGSRTALGSHAGSRIQCWVRGFMLIWRSRAESGMHLGILKIVSMDLLTLKT